MKKHLLMAISLISVLVVGMTVFAACGKKHNFSKTYTYDNEYHWHACSDKDCKEVKDKAKHTYGEWKITKKPTATEKGMKTRYCTVCTKKQTEEIPALQANPVTLKEGAMLDKKYDGKAVMFSKEQFNFMGTGAVTFMYKMGEDEWTAEAPMAVGAYKLKVMVAESDMYQAGVAEFDFEIKKGDNSITLKDGEMLGKTYDGTAVEITKEKFNVMGTGDVTFKFKAVDAEEWVDEAPMVVGKYQVKVMVAECMNYNAGEKVFDFEIKKAENNVTLKEGETLDKVYDGSAVAFTKEQFNFMGTGDVSFMFKAVDAEEWTTEAPMAVGAYKLKVTVAETDMYQAGVAEFDFEIKKGDNSITLKDGEMLDKKYDGEAVAFTKEQFNFMGDGAVSFKFKAVDAEEWVDEAPMAVGAYKLKVMVAETDMYQAGVAEFDFEIKKGDNSITLKDGEMLDKKYDGEAVAFTKEQFNFMGDGAVSFKFKAVDAEEWVDEAPMAVGAYKLKVMVAETDMYQAGVAEFDFEIKKADNSITLKEGEMLGKTYDGTAVEITKEKFNVMGTGDVTFMFKAKAEGDDKWTAEAPMNAGEYQVKVMVAECMNYNAGEKVFDFEIKKAENSITLKESVTLGKVADGTPVVITADMFNFMGEGAVTFMFQTGDGEWTNTAPSAEGAHKVKVMVAESANYKMAEAIFEFTITPPAPVVE